MLKKILTIGIFTCCLFLTHIQAKDTIIVSIEPQKYFLKQIAKDNFKIKVIVTDGYSPEDYTPRPNQSFWMDMDKAFFSIGVPYEKKWFNQINIKKKDIKIFDISKNIPKIKGDPYIWLEPSLVKLQAKNILNALIELDAENEKFYRKNYFKFVNTVSRLDFQIRSVLKKAKRKSFVVFSPSWGYFAKKYQLEQIYIKADPDSIEEDNIVDIVNSINEHNARLIFVPKHFPDILTRNIDRNTDAHTIPISPLAYNWLDNLLNVAKIIAYQKR